MRIGVILETPTECLAIKTYKLYWDNPVSYEIKKHFNVYDHHLVQVISIETYWAYTLGLNGFTFQASQWGHNLSNLL